MQGWNWFFFLKKIFEKNDEIELILKVKIKFPQLIIKGLNWQNLGLTEEIGHYTVVRARLVIHTI